jgi:replicative DNA helicase
VTRTIPHDLSAEASVLGGIILRNEALTLLDRLEVEDFYSPKHQAVFQAMRNLEARAMPIDHVTLEGELERIGRLEAIGGTPFLFELMGIVPSLDSVQHYAEILAGHRTSREVQRACSSIVEAVYTGSLEGDEAVREAVVSLMAIQSRKPDPGRTVGQLMREEIRAIGRDVASGNPAAYAVSTGVETLDRHTGGYPIGSVSIVLGATGHGKSTLLGCGARAGSAAGDLCIVYSLEDPAKFWGQRALAQESGIPTEQIVRRRNAFGGAFGESEYLRLQKAIPTAAQRTEILVPAAQWTPDQLIRDVQSRRAKDRIAYGRKRRCSVWVDYVQVFRLEIARNGNREQGIANAMDRLSWLAQGCGSADTEDECAVIAGSQVKQVVIDDKRAPRINDGADSFSIAKVCKFMLGINRPAKYDENADPKFGRVDVLKRNQGDDEIHADVEMNLATHTITARAHSDREPDWRNR